MTLHFVLSSICFTFILCGQDAAAIDSHPKNDSNRYLNTLQIIRKYGYPAEAHTVQTADGYILEMHRIPHGLDPTVKKTPPVFIQHGLLGSSSDFVIMGANQSLEDYYSITDEYSYLTFDRKVTETKDLSKLIKFSIRSWRFDKLVDLGYDVWLGNVRGNAYSTGHVSLNPNDREFWDFSWHESAIYDLPAQIDFIRNYTDQEKVIYVGFSMGTTMFIAMISVLPEYNEKVELSLLLAVVVYAKHVRSPLLRLLAPFSLAGKFILDVFSGGAVLPERGFWTALFRGVCTYLKLAATVCLGGFYIMFGVDISELDESRYNIYLGHYPSGYSFKSINHYSQLLKSGEFCQYDYGPIGNELKYGSVYPPEYRVENIKVPMYFYEGQNDFLSTLPDVNRVSKRLSTLQDIRVIDYPKFNHLDFVIAKHVKEFLNDRIIEDLESYFNKTR